MARERDAKGRARGDGAASEAKGAPKKVARAGGGKRRAALERRLLELPERDASPPDASVVTIVHEVRALEAILRKFGKVLLSGTKLDRKTPAELAARRAALEEAERAWLATRKARGSRAVRRLRNESEGLVRDVTAAVRYFLEHDEGAQRCADAIREVTSDGDRAFALERCAELLEGHVEALKKADLPKKASELCRDLAGELARASDVHDGDGAAQEQALRNRAYWHLRELIDEIRAAGRYVFRHEPKRLMLFRPSGTPARRVSNPPSPGET